ncbi:MAG TPA: hypothetical protein VFM96_09750 [Gaiellaceae bacterium]|nr:hypothetical protein [Gaiellaceae bacterium]
MRTSAKAAYAVRGATLADAQAIPLNFLGEPLEFRMSWVLSLKAERAIEA